MGIRLLEVGEGGAEFSEESVVDPPKARFFKDAATLAVRLKPKERYPSCLAGTVVVAGGVEGGAGLFVSDRSCTWYR